MTKENKIEKLDEAVKFWKQKVLDYRHQLEDAQAELNHVTNQRSLAELRTKKEVKTHTTVCHACGRPK